MKKSLCFFIVILLFLSSMNVFAESTGEAYDYTYPSNDGIRIVRSVSDSSDYRYGYIDEEGKLL